MNLLVTGAGGFIGSRLLDHLLEGPWQVRATVRDASRAPALPCDVFATGDLQAGGCWETAVEGVDCVIHLAGRAHVMGRTPGRSEESILRAVNVEATRRLAVAAVRARVRRLIFVSSIGVFGPAATDHPFTERDGVRPVEPYARTKLEAERALREVEARHGLEVVVVRPPMVYGPGAPGNLERLMRLIARGIPIPVPVPPNARSLAAVDNLVDFLCVCAADARAAGETFVIADGEDFSTAQMICLLANGMRRPARTVSLPRGLLRGAASLTRTRAFHEKVFGSLRVDSTKARRTLGWGPVVSPREVLMEAGRTFCRQNGIGLS